MATKISQAQSMLAKARMAQLDFVIAQQRQPVVSRGCGKCSVCRCYCPSTKPTDEEITRATQER